MTPANPGPGPACRSCGAPIVWVVVRPGGRRMPVDAEPGPDGTVVIDSDGTMARVLSGAALVGARVDGTPLYLSHFATCPQAGEWRRG